MLGQDALILLRLGQHFSLEIIHETSATFIVGLYEKPDTRDRQTAICCIRLARADDRPTNSLREKTQPQPLKNMPQSSMRARVYHVGICWCTYLILSLTLRAAKIKQVGLHCALVLSCAFSSIVALRDQVPNADAAANAYAALGFLLVFFLFVHEAQIRCSGAGRQCSRREQSCLLLRVDRRSDALR